MTPASNQAQGASGQQGQQGQWEPKQQVGFATGRPGRWIVERVTPGAGIETMHDKRGAFVFRTEAEARAAIAAAQGAAK